MSGLAAKLRWFARSAGGRVLRAPLGLVPRERALPILWGKLRGWRWVVGSSFQSCWLGVYEYEKQQVFVRTVKPGDVVYDVGANVGFYTLLASRLVGPGGRVFSFEPLPRNIKYLRRHLDANGVTNVTVFEGAVSDRSGTARFDVDAIPEMTRLSAGGSLEVQTFQIDELIAAGQATVPTLMKIDVEGAEADVLEGARDLLTRHHPTVLLATHNDEVHRRCWDVLAGLGYQVEALDDTGPYREVLAKYPAP